MKKADELLYQAWCAYSKILGYRKLMLLRWKNATDVVLTWYLTARK